MRTSLSATPFDPFAALREAEQAMNAAGRFGALASFVGTMRDFNQGDVVEGMWLEHYPGMTEKYLDTISAEAARRWDLVDTLIIHRYGEIRVADPIVLVAVWSAHRAEAFEACRYLIEDLKARAPFWKRESLPARERWVTHNTPG